MPPKAPITCNWMRSNVTDETLANFVKSGYLPKKEVMSYRAPDPSEERPQPRDGEVVIFADHEPGLRTARLKILPGRAQLL